MYALKTEEKKKKKKKNLNMMVHAIHVSHVPSYLDFMRHANLYDMIVHACLVE